MGDEASSSNIDQKLDDWGRALLKSLDIEHLRERKPIAHKWKAMYRALLLRELVFWRVHDLLMQSKLLHREDCLLGARILLRSAFETVASLGYLNLKISQVVKNELDFFVFSGITEQLVYGCRDDDGPIKPVNVMTTIEKLDKKYEGLKRLYDSLSETAHPNRDGLCLGYLSASKEEMTNSFSNNWPKIFAGNHLNGIYGCILAFEQEYDVEWPNVYEALEKWLEENDASLEETRKVRRAKGIS